MQICAFGVHRNNVSAELWRQTPAAQQKFRDCCEQFYSLKVDRESLFVTSSHSIEIFALLGDAPRAKETLQKYLTAFLSTSTVKSPAPVPLHCLEGPEAVRHFLHLSLGIEPISPQPQNDFLENASKSIAIANENGSAGPVLNRLYQTALMLAGKIEQGELSYDCTFIMQQIQNLAKKIFVSSESIGLMMVGTNALSDLLLDATAAHPMRKRLYASETAGGHGSGPGMKQVQNISPDRVYPELQDVQLVLRMNHDFSENFSATTLQAIMSLRKNRPLLIINLDTTITAEASLNKIYNLFVYDLADFQPPDPSPQNIFGFAKELVEHELKQFFAWFYSKEHYRFGNIIGKSRPMEHVLELIARISQTDITVLIQGESGTGKELVARALHANSPRHARAFISLNCGALPDTLLESELFGHVRGAFTGAIDTKKGLIEEANRGTLLLDEIGDTSPAFQVNLLRVLQEGETRRVGSTEFKKADVRIIAATNKRLNDLVLSGAFRQDLYYRIAVVQIDLPSLRERDEDIPLLVRHFIAKYSEKMKKRVTGLEHDAEKMILAYTWPGNVRELENAVEHAVALSVGHLITPEDLPPQIRVSDQEARAAGGNDILPLKEIERRHITQALHHYAWDYDHVARALGIGRTTLWRKIRDFNIAKPGSGDGTK